MALQRCQAWLTCVTRDDTVMNALVLAESLRRTRTNRRIAVVISKNVSQETTQILQKAFDDVFLINDNLVGTEGDEQLRGKVFAFSLEVYQKCVFLGANTVVLENCDKLFEDKKQDTYKDFSKDWEVFRFAPNQAISEYFLKQCQVNGKKAISKKGFGIAIEEWVSNNKHIHSKSREDSSELTLLKFSVRTGRMQVIGNGLLQPLVGQFVDIPNNHVELVGRLVELKENPGLGLHEKALVREWLNVFENRVSRIKTDPRAVSRWRGDTPTNEPIAIVGMSCRFPGANNLEEFWNLLYAGEDSICPPPAFRWTKEQAVFGHGKIRETEAGFLKTTIDDFDSKFFGMSPKDTELLDPQGRLLHEVMWEALENSAIDPMSLYGTYAGIFTGSWMNDYKDVIHNSSQKDFFRTYMGNSIGATAARLSFLLGLTGPSIATESGCSSAIVALDLAVKSLRSMESDLAISGGVNLLLHPFKSDIIDYIIAPNGRCKTFDEKADGFGRAEGCGVLILKRLSDALRDNDNIWALIRGSAISQEGISRTMGTPTVLVEALCMEMAMEDGGVRPEEVSFVETHGTGTQVGDPMEVAAIAKAYHTENRKQPMVIGSVKTNVGHTESCSGITGIIKTVLAMQNELIPKHLHFETMNPNIDLESIPAKIPLEPTIWLKIQGRPRLAGVSSFGITGTDGHVILEESPDYELPKLRIELERPLHIIKFSAKSDDSLNEVLRLFAESFRNSSGKDEFADAAYTANVGRASFTQRAFVLASSFEEAVKSLESNKAIRGDATITNDAAKGKICFLFTGQGSQYLGMAKLLYETSPVFQLWFDQCDMVLRDQYNLSIRQTLWEADSQSKELSRTIYSQTSIFVIEYCLLKLWESWGIKPDYVLGHSLGEFCAAVAAGILTFEDALMLVAERSRLIDTLPRGSMLVIKANKSEVAKLMASHKIDLDWAAINSSDQTVVAGDTDKVVTFLDVCKSSGLKATILEATHAFHSRHMDPMLKEYRKICTTIKQSNKIKCEYISGMRGTLIKDPSVEIDADYWTQHTREKVSFLDACQTLRKLECENYLEMGPQPVLSSFVMQNIDDLTTTCYPSLRRNTNDWETILLSLGKLYLKGFKVDWVGYDKLYQRKKMPTLPNYPMNRKSFWVDCYQEYMEVIHPLIGYPLPSAAKQNIFQNDINTKAVPYLQDHCIGHMTVFPGAGFTEMCLTAGYCVANSFMENIEKPTRAVAVENVRIETPLEIKERTTRRLQTIVNFQEGEEGSGLECTVYHHNQNEGADTTSSKNWVQHASATFHPFVKATTLLKEWDSISTTISEIMTSQEATSCEDFYKSVDSTGLRFGEQFRRLQQYWYVPMENEMDEVVAEMQSPNELEKYLLHPLIIDSMMVTAILGGWRMQNEREKGTKLRVPIRIGKLTLLNSIPEKENDGKLYLHSKWGKDGQNKIFVSTSNWTPIAVMEDLEVIETTVKTIQSVLEQQNSKVPESWEEVWKPVRGPFDKRVDLSTTNLEEVFSSKELEHELTTTKTLVTPDEPETLRKMNRVLYLYMLKALLKLGWSVQKGERWNEKSIVEKCNILPMYVQQVRFYLAVFEAENYLFEIKREQKNGETVWKIGKISPAFTEDLDSKIDALHNEIKADERMSTVMDIYRSIGRQLHEFLSGTSSALQALFPVEGSDNYAERKKLSAEEYYVRYPGRRCVDATLAVIFRNIWKSIIANNEGNSNGKVYRVLEVGAGTGSTTKIVLKTLKETWGVNFEYYYSDISAAFFTLAQHKFHEMKEHLRFCTFNVEEPPNDQGVPVNFFDMVIASDVLHATTDLRRTLRNVRQVLRPQGIVCMSEIMDVMEDKGTTFIFGLLEGFWLFKDFDTRPHHCTVDGNTWMRLCREVGFEFTNTTNTYMNVFGCVTAGAGKAFAYEFPVQLESTEKRKWVVFAPHKDESLERVVTAMKATGYSINIAKPYGAVLRDEDKTAGMINSVLQSSGEIQGVLYAWGMDTTVTDQKRLAMPLLHLAKRLLEIPKSPRLYVLTRGVHGFVEMNDDLNPSGATLIGMGKTLKNECWDMIIRLVDLEVGNEQALEVEQILFELAMNKETRERERLQVCYRNNVRYEPRLLKGTLAQNAVRHNLQLPLCSERYQLMLPKTKAINDLTFDVLEEEPVAENEVEVAVKAYALNFRDILTILKPIEEFENYNNVGLDFAGVVTRVGDLAEEKLKVGDRVFGLKTKQSPLPSHTVIEANSLMKIPDKMTFAEAATLPAVFATSFYCLFTVARMKRGDTVLIHTGSGGVGLSAIQLAKQVGANIITTAGSTRKRAYLRSLGIQHVFHSRNTSYKEDILRVTNGKGVDIVLNSITGPGFKEATLDVSAKNARFIEMSRLSVWTEEEVKKMRPDVEYTLVDLTQLDSSVWDKLLQSIKMSLDDGQVTPIPYVQFDALRIRQAFQFFQKAKHIGKLIVTMPEQTIVGGQLKLDLKLFNPEGSYLVTGGLGGIGFEVCKWMIAKGATDIVLIGRNPPKPDIEKEIQLLNEGGAKVSIKLADVGDETRLKQVIDEIVAEGGKPIRGIHHCAGVLSDNMFSNQTWAGFEATYTPKVKGSWNLHNLTKNMPLEQFVFYSSLTAMAGSPGQANHVSANCFEDAFARYRYAMGLPATTVNWGQWAQVGVAREINLSGVLPISVARMFNALEEILRDHVLQIAVMEFENFSTWNALCPTFKYYLDERLWKSVQNDSGVNSLLLKSDQFWQEMDEAETKETKMEVVMVYMKVILRNALRMEPDEPINNDVNIKDLGVDSLMLIELKNSIQSLMGTRLTVTANMLKDCNTIRDLASAIVSKLVDADYEEDQSFREPLPGDELLELMQKDSCLDESIQAPSEACRPSEIRTLLVTGTTGQMGPYMLAAIFKIAPQVEKVVCLIRTRRNQPSPMEKLKTCLESCNLLSHVDMNKIECVQGDIIQPEFGLETEQYNALANSLDAVIHLAAKSNHIEFYRKSEKDFLGSDIRSAIVGGTLNVLRFASTGKTKHVFFASSILCVFGEKLDDDGELCDNWPEEKEMQIVTNNTLMGYACAKHVAELLLKQAVLRGIPCKAFRFPWVLGESETGRIDFRQNHYILRMMTYLKMKAMPASALPAIVFPVDVCSEHSVRIFWTDEAGPEVYNISHPNPELEVEFVTVAREEFGVDVNLVEWETKEQMQDIYAKGMPLESFKELYEGTHSFGYLRDATNLRAIQGYLNKPDRFFRNKKVESFIKGFGNSVPSTMELLKRNLHYAKSQGLFKQFGI